MYHSFCTLVAVAALWTGSAFASETGSSLEDAFGAVHVPGDQVEALDYFQSAKHTVIIGQTSTEHCGCAASNPKKFFAGQPVDCTYIALDVPCGSQLKCNKLFADECESEQDDMLTLAECLSRSQTAHPIPEESNIAFSEESERAIESEKSEMSDMIKIED